MSLLHSSKRRPAALKDTDYDHEIVLEDHTATRARSRSSLSASERQQSPGVVSDTSSRRHSDVPLRKHTTPRKVLRKEITRRRYGKYQEQEQVVGSGDGPYDQLEETNTREERQDEEVNGDGGGGLENGHTNDTSNGVVEGDGEERGRPKQPKPKPKHKDPESAIDILYENQRGGFMCGIPLFSAKALGNLDPAPWTNVALKTSATNITNAQVPDPSWEWAWKEWSINHSDEVDEDGWEYSFAFSKKFSWHGSSWWNSFVRRRAWIRKRVKKNTHYHVEEAHMLNSDYFTIHPAQERSHSRPSTLDGTLGKRYSSVQLGRRDMEEIIPEDITDISALMKALRAARIDREKMEAVENFIKNGGEELYYLRERMHDIMGMFIFQNSRRLLLSHILKIFDEATEQQNKDSESKENIDPIKAKRLDNLENALKHADEEVRRLEFWSDVKDMAEKGETKGAVDGDQGWGEEWAGIDRSGPEDVISNKAAVGTDDCKKSEKNGSAITSAPKEGKGKEKEK